MPEYNQNDDAFKPIQPHSQNPQEPQKKLVLGSFQDDEPPRSTPRQSYRYPGQQAGQDAPRYPPQPHADYASRQPQPYQGPQPGMQPPGNFYQQPGQFPRNSAAPRRPGRRRGRTRRGCAIGCLSVLLLLVILGCFLVNIVQRTLAFGTAISTEPPLSTQTSYMGTTDRTNLLVLGYGGGAHDGSYLTDSIVAISVQPQSHHTSLVSVPRDLWVQYPPNSGNYTKINSIYELASSNNKNVSLGGGAIAQKVSLITGMNVKYWLTIDFTGFKQVIDSIGGIDVYVPDSFNACYPKNDDAEVDASWIKVQFNKGMQHMNGATAIEYARAREPLEVCGMGTSENLAELTDFGRSARQQIIMKAVLSKVKESSTWPHMYDAMSALQKTIHTNMSLADLASFALKMDLNDPKSARIGLSNQNVLEDSQTSGGEYILAPANNDWGAIPPYIQQHLYK
ncbi:MAG TPA: LCP family protein [Ktedonobacteraceae bacterium]|jgi:LCP family protein required for cell wall assembly|nr:LCP family protein [Ktedonobacteraceae bacterium]